MFVCVYFLGNYILKSAEKVINIRVLYPHGRIKNLSFYIMAVSVVKGIIPI